MSEKVLKIPMLCTSQSEPAAMYVLYLLFIGDLSPVGRHLVDGRDDDLVVSNIIGFTPQIPSQKKYTLDKGYRRNKTNTA